MTGWEDGKTHLTVVVYGALEETDLCLRSLVNVDGEYALSVIDNKPTAESQSVIVGALGFLKEMSPVMTSYIRMARNVGYGAACNYSVKMTRHMTPNVQMFGFLNSDTQMREGVITRMLDASFAGWGVAGPRQVDSRGRITHGGIIGDSPVDCKHRGWLSSDLSSCLDTIGVPTVSGSAYFVARGCWDELAVCAAWNASGDHQGAFLPTRHFYEETALSAHAAMHGWKILYDGTVTMIHEWGRSTPKGWASEMFRESRARYDEFIRVHREVIAATAPEPLEEP